jgi:hypothetical protein
MVKVDFETVAPLLGLRSHAKAQSRQDAKIGETVFGWLVDFGERAIS